MTDTQPAAPTPAGWYADPSVAGQNRWWDGQNWADATQPTAPAVAPYGTVPAAQPYAAQPYAAQPYAAQPYAAQPYSLAPQQLSAADPMTPFIWAIAVWPLIGLLNLAFYGLLGGYDYSIVMSGESGPWTVADLGLSFLAYAGMVVVAFLDHRALKARGLQPFPWGWAFVPIVYVIGRTVVIYRQTHRALAPLFIYIGAFLFIRILGVVIGFVIGLNGLN